MKGLTIKYKNLAIMVFYNRKSSRFQITIGELPSKLIQMFKCQDIVLREFEKHQNPNAHRVSEKCIEKVKTNIKKTITFC